MSRNYSSFRFSVGIIPWRYLLFNYADYPWAYFMLAWVKSLLIERLFCANEVFDIDISEVSLNVPGLVSFSLRFCYNLGKLMNLGASESIFVMKVVLSCSTVCKLACCKLSICFEIDCETLSYLLIYSNFSINVACSSWSFLSAILSIFFCLLLSIAFLW